MTSKSVAALTSAALALPGMMPKAVAEAPVQSPQFDLRYSRYQESDNRMEVNVVEGAATIPLGDRVDFSVDVVKDIISGASPIFKQPTADGSDVVQVMTGASLREERTVMDFNTRYYFDDLTFGLGVGVSTEKDYDARFVDLEARWDINQKMTTLALGFGTSVDEIEPSTNDLDEDLLSYKVHVGITQILDKHSLIQLNSSYTKDTGFLSHPYKQVFIEDLGIVDDTRPDNRDQWTLLTRYVRHLDNWDAALHLDYRFYIDSWGIDAHTFDLSWHQSLSHGWELVPRLRYHSQDEAEFYQDFFITPRADGNHSSDYRLASFGAISGGLRINKAFGDKLYIDVGVEHYERKADLSLNGDSETDVDDFSFTIFDVGLRFRF